ncbi:ABC transporter domain-containing protein [Heracleum sosnowskyi]|uniref:ABC transporter domain-containing protein n=1 Tax=Heracleum sosnowskyi TaxID=360622 RepID=A0AAD8GU55_9APIA|nr:ABC transporter domain-containing protein [Heracleum sosnowskyi]
MRVKLEIKEAERIANAHHFISSSPHGYGTHVGMRGDEASSSIQSESSRVVQEALDTLVMGKKTTIILIAHGAAMMRHVDDIVVLNGGRIVEEGSHDMLARNGLYVWLMQPHFGKGMMQRRLI